MDSRQKARIRAYMEKHNCDPITALLAMPEMTPGDEVDARVRQYMFEHLTVNYTEAYRTVLNLDPALKKRYAES